LEKKKDGVNSSIKGVAISPMTKFYSNNVFDVC